ncbi:MAG: VWA domain-containing protein [Actinomycetota bacterium]
MTAGEERRFPFAAVVGQDDAKLALQLLAVDPRIGGVLLRGEKGSAKTTLARGLADLLPGEAAFVDLPLGATEDRVIGTLDMASALGGGAPEVRPGLLAAAHDGVLYVDEINLLADHLVDTLLDVSVSGINRIERDGISNQHDARFVLIGSMNPEEGELRPQLLDRFGLSVAITASVDPAERAAAVRRRLAFDGATVAASAEGPGGHGATVAASAEGPGGHESTAASAEGPEGDEGVVAAESARLRATLAAARPAAVPDELVETASRLALAVGAEGLRADLVLCRAAAAHAGLHGRPVAHDDDLRRVAPLVLAHRSRRNPFDPPVLPPEQLADAIDDAFGEADDSSNATPPPPSPPTDTVDPPAGDDDRANLEPPSTPSTTNGGSGADGPTVAMTLGADRRPPIDAGGTARPVGGTATAMGRRRVVTEGDRGRHVRDEAFDPASTRPIAVAATVRRVADKRRHDPEAAVELGDLRQAVRAQPSGTLLILVVDTSGSMGADARAELATGTALGLLADAYERRDHVALITFAGDGAEIALAPTGSVEVARNRLGALATGGPTPLAAGLDRARELAHRRRDQGRTPFVVVISDGRATSIGDRSNGADDDPLAAALAAANQLRSDGIGALVLDCESGTPRLGLAPRLAEALAAPCVAAADLDSATASATIRTISNEVLDAR